MLLLALYAGGAVWLSGCGEDIQFTSSPDVDASSPGDDATMPMPVPHDAGGGAMDSTAGDTGAGDVGAPPPPADGGHPPDGGPPPPADAAPPPPDGGPPPGDAGPPPPPPDGGPPPPPDGGPPPPPEDAGQDASSACGTCPANDVCCEAPAPCAGQCVPDCRLTGQCPNNLTCDPSTGLCDPGDAGGPPPPQDGGQPPPPDGGRPPPPDGGRPPPPDGGGGPPPGDAGGPPPRDAGAPPPDDAGAGIDSGSDASSPAEGYLQGNAVYTKEYNANNVSISGTTVALGGESANCENGKALVYTWDGAAWSLQQTVSGYGSGVLECYGASVAVDGDMLAVGAPMEPQSMQPGALTVGAVWTYTRSGGTWTQQQEIAGPGPFDFGWSLSLDGTQMAIGMPRIYNGNNSETGEVFVYSEQRQWSQSAAITAPLPVAFGNFGESVALVGTELVIGAPGDWVNGQNAQPGIVYGYTGSGSNWTFKSAVQPSDVTVSDLFGFSVAMVGHTMIAGAPQNDRLGTDAGAAYVFVLSNGSWVENTQILASDAAAGDKFGYTVAAVSDTELLVGAPGALKVYDFKLENNQWTQSTIYTACTSSQLGFNLATNGNLAVSGHGNDWVWDLTQPNNACLP